MNRYQFMTLGSLGLAGTALYRAHACKTEAPAAQPFPEEKINFERLCSNLTRAIQIPTVSCEDEVETDWAQFEKFRSFLREAYPRCFSEMEVTEIAGASLLLFLPGSDTSLEPIGFCAHQDVVPVPEDTVKDWKYPPYSGHNDGAFIYGRGAIDMKNHLLSLLEAVESLLEEGYQPKRGLYLMFGHNEEIVSGRSNGAEAIAAELERRGVHLDSIVDEGGAVFDIGRPDLLDGDIAAIGIAEKGYCDVKITVAGKGGHSSRPPKHSAIGELSKKIVRLENHPFRGKMPDYLPPLLRTIGSRMAFPVRLLTANLDVLRPLLVPVMEQIPAAAGLIRTTQCVTMSEGAPAGNIMPESASAVVNCRMMQGTTMEDVRRHIEKYVGGKGTKVEIIKGKEASIVSPTDSRAFQTLSNLILQADHKAVIAPYLDMGGTDCFHYENVCSNIYRFAPYRFTAEIIGTTHGTNERMPLKEYNRGTQFFKRYMRVMTSE